MLDMREREVIRRIKVIRKRNDSLKIASGDTQIADLLFLNLVVVVLLFGLEYDVQAFG